MSTDIRSKAARYYDYNPDFPKDVSFYEENTPSQYANVLELGCGTGRVTIPLSGHCKKIHGIDLSEAMVAICREKLDKQRIPTSKIIVEVGDIADFESKQKFDLIIAPFRVFQNLETDDAVKLFFDCVRKHLAPGGTCILNVFNPYKDRETLQHEWCSESETLSWEVEIEGQKIACYERRPRMNKERLILYPELIYRRYEKEDVVDEAVLNIGMRCYYPDEFEELIGQNGFSITNRWGGYDGEKYGTGPELVIEFRN